MIKSALAGFFLCLFSSVVTNAHADVFGCNETLLLKDFKAQGGKLIEVGPRDLKIPPCPDRRGCAASTVLHVLARQDGSVLITGADHTFGLFTDLVADQVASMRYVPPQLGNRKVCVAFDLAWNYLEDSRHIHGPL